MNKLSASLILLLTFLLFTPGHVFSAADHLIINEVQIAGTTATDEFVEIFNPTVSDVDVTGWRLTKKTSGGVQANLVSSMSGVVAAGGHLLVAHPNYDGSVLADASYSAASNSIASNGTVLLYSDAGTTLVDKVGLGTATDFETASVESPAADGSVSRVNDDDTNDNSTDFEVLVTSDPQNSASGSATPSPSPSESPSPSPSVSPSASPSATPTESPSPSPTATAEPTESPSPTPAPTDEPTPEPTSTPRSRRLGRLGFGSSSRVCRLQYRTVRIGFFSYSFPRIVCS